MHRVVVTGIGAIGALGRDAGEFTKSLMEGRCGIVPIQSTDCSALRFRNGAEVQNYHHRPYFDDKRADFIDRFAQFAVIAAREAVELAGIEWTPQLRESAAIRALHKKRTPPVTRPAALSNANLGDEPGNRGAAPRPLLGRFRDKLNCWITLPS